MQNYNLLWKNILCLFLFSGAQAYGLSKYGSGGIAIDDTAYLCDGTEDSLGACDTTDANNCGTGNVAGVKCNSSPGPCEAAGHTGCCISGCNAGGCYCDSACYGFGDCCSDISNTCPQGDPVAGKERIMDMEWVNG